MSNRHGYSLTVRLKASKSMSLLLIHIVIQRRGYLYTVSTGIHTQKSTFGAGIYAQKSTFGAGFYTQELTEKRSTKGLRLGRKSLKLFL